MILGFKMLEKISFNFNLSDAEACIECRRMPARKAAHRLANVNSSDKFVEEYPWYKNDDITALLDYAAFLSKEEMNPFFLNNQEKSE